MLIIGKPQVPGSVFPDRLKRLLAAGLEMVLPLHCLECNRAFSNCEKAGIADAANDMDDAFYLCTGNFLCPNCRRSFRAIRSPMCSCCGMPFESPHGADHLCGECRQSPAQFDRARSLGIYQAALRTLVHQFKYHGCVQLADPLGYLLWMVFRSHWDSDAVDTVVPVPLHPKRLRQRGFNQAHQLIRAWPKLAAAQGVEMKAMAFSPGLLQRRRFTAPQTGMDRRERAENVKGAFGISEPRAVAGRRMLLVDDVLTTGATLEACARLLKQAGAAQVDVLTLARAA